MDWRPVQYSPCLCPLAAKICHSCHVSLQSVMVFKLICLRCCLIDLQSTFIIYGLNIWDTFCLFYRTLFFFIKFLFMRWKSVLKNYNHNATSGLIIITERTSWYSQPLFLLCRSAFVFLHLLNWTYDFSPSCNSACKPAAYGGNYSTYSTQKSYLSLCP